MQKDDIELSVSPSSERDHSRSNDLSSNHFDSDDVILRRLGRCPLLNRSFGFMSILGLSCSTLCSWEGILVSFVPSFLTAGPAAVIWSFLIGWVGVVSIYTVLTELASIAPTAGGQCISTAIFFFHILPFNHESIALLRLPASEYFVSGPKWVFLSCRPLGCSYGT